MNAANRWTAIGTGLTGGTVDSAMTTGTKIGLAGTAHPPSATTSAANLLNTTTFTNVTPTR